MIKNIDWKRFLIAMIILCPLLVALDIAYDAIFKTVEWKNIFAADNLFFKIAAAIAGSYFYATYNNTKSEK